MTICKSFITPHVDYGPNESLHQSLESLKYSAAIAITGAVRGTSYEKLFQELGLETVNQGVA